MDLKRDAIDFSKDPVTEIFRRMFFPTLIGMVSMVVLNISDGAFVGHGVGSDALAAVNIVAPMFMISGGIGLMFGIGSSVVASIHLSKDNTHAANINITQGVIGTVLVGLIVATVVLLYQRETCLLFGCSEALVPLACSYLKWIAIVTPSNMLGMTAMFAVRLDGNPRFAMIMNCSMAFANIFLDWLLIYPGGMGLEGAAIATCTAFGLGNIPLLWFMFTRMKKVHLCKLKMTMMSLRLTMRNLFYQMKIGISGLIGELSLAVVIIVGNYVFMNYIGEDGVAAFSVACYCLPIVFMIGNAIVQSIQPVISFAYGQQEHVRLREAVRIAMTSAFLTGIGGMLLMMLGAGLITEVFLPSDCRAFEICQHGLPLYSSAFMFVAMNIVMIGCLQSVEATRQATLFTMLRGIILSIPSFIFLPMLVGEDGLWFALPLAEAVTMLLIIATYTIKNK